MSTIPTHLNFIDSLVLVTLATVIAGLVALLLSWTW
jgi:hypothetical protein